MSCHRTHGRPEPPTALQRFRQKPGRVTSPARRPTVRAADPRENTEAWQRRYSMRAGCEATVSETVHAHGLRRCRYRGVAKTHVQHVLTAAGTNIARPSACFRPGTIGAAGARPDSHFQRLCDALAASSE
ncbi:transposase [Streptomyces sp. ISL-14]|nr:transposase [Streptomyces sp. ISL-14]